MVEADRTEETAEAGEAPVDKATRRTEVKADRGSGGKTTGTGTDLIEGEAEEDARGESKAEDQQRDSK